IRPDPTTPRRWRGGVDGQPRAAGRPRGRPLMAVGTAWVTGGSSGIGRAVVDGLVAGGASVAVLHVADPGRTDGAYQRCDLADAASVAAALDALETTVGPPDGLVLCAGVMSSQPVDGHDEETWRRVLEVNLTSALLVLRRVLGPMRARCSGRIVT